MEYNVDKLNYRCNNGQGMQEMMGTQAITSVTKVKIKISISDRMQPRESSSKTKCMYNHNMGQFNLLNAPLWGSGVEVCPQKGQAFFRIC